MGIHADLAPGAIGNSGHEVVAIASIGLTGPGAHADDLFAEAGCSLVDLLHRDQAVIGFVGEATFEPCEGTRNWPAP